MFKDYRTRNQRLNKTKPFFNFFEAHFSDLRPKKSKFNLFNVVMWFCVGYFGYYIIEALIYIIWQ